jgi:hypothetical protein
MSGYGGCAETYWSLWVIHSDFGESHAMITQNCENSKKSVFCHTLRAQMGMKGTKRTNVRFSDLRAL